MGHRLAFNENFVDLPGVCSLTYLPGESRVLTCGTSSSEVRLWQIQADGSLDSPIDYGFDEPAISIAANEKYIFALLKNGTLSCADRTNVEDLEDLAFTTILDSLEKVTCLDVQSHPHNRIAIGTEDGTILFYSLQEDSSWKEGNKVQSHEGAVFSVLFDPTNKWLVSSGSDSSVAVWSVESSELYKRIDNLIASSFTYNEECRLGPVSWFHSSSDQFLLFVASKKSVVAFDSNGGFTEKCFEASLTESVNTDLKFVSVSNDGRYIATADERQVFVFNRSANINSTPIVSKVLEDSKIITGMSFDLNTSHQLSVVSNDGVLLSMRIESSESKVDKTVPTVTNVEESFDLMDDGDDSLFDQISITADKTSIEPKPDSMLPSFDDDQQLSSLALPASGVSEALDDDAFSDVAEFDIGAIKKSHEAAIFGTSIDTNSSTKNHSNFNANGEFYVDGYRIDGKELASLIRQSKKTSIETMQEPFQSGSTPVHHQRRFMVWNSVGIVYSHHDDSENSIDVEFQDTTFHHSIHLENDLNYTIADLSSSCLLLVSNHDEVTDEKRCKMFCQLLKTWDKIKVWNATLPEDESALTVAAGHTFIAIATSTHNLRIWTVGGVQTQIVSMFGPPLTLSASEDQLMMLYHQGAQYSGRGQSLACQVLKIDHRVRARKHLLEKPVQVALSPNSTVYWAGFTDEFAPCVVDSQNVVRVFKTSVFGGAWLPVADLKKASKLSSQDNFFVVGISELLNQIRCIFCKASKYPITSPRPIMTVKPLLIPLAELDTQKGRHEETLLRNRLSCMTLKKLSVEGFDVDNHLEGAIKQVNASCVKLFAMALIAGRESLALEIVKMMPDQVAVEGAIRFAQDKGNRSMATRLIELLQNDELNQDDDEEDVELEQIMQTRHEEADGWVDQLDGLDPPRRPRTVGGISEISDSSADVALKPKKMGTKNAMSVLMNSNARNRANNANDDQPEEPEEVPKLAPAKMSGKNPFKRAAAASESTSIKRKKV